MIKNLFVSNLSPETTSDDLRALFEPHGPVTRSQVIADRETGESRCFAFLEMPEGGDAAISALHGAMMNDLPLIVSEAKPRNYRPRAAVAADYGRGFGRRY